MASFTLSPGVVIQEVDNTLTVPAQQINTAAAAGVFAWGPVAQPQLIATEAQLAATYGAPQTGFNTGTWWNIDNFLQYSAAVWVNRAADSAAINATGGAGTNSPAFLVNNSDAFVAVSNSIPAGTNFIAKYPGALGNSLEVVVCDSAAAFTSNTTTPANTSSVSFTFSAFSNTATLTVVADSNTDASQGAQTIAQQLAVGDFIAVGNSTVGQAKLQITGIGTPTLTANNTASAQLTFANKAYISAEWTSNVVSRTWQYSNIVGASPGTSTYAASKGGSGDQISIVVIDKNGSFTGSPGAVLEVYDRLSRATDGVNASGVSNYYRSVINTQSPFIWVGSDLTSAPTGLASAIRPSTDVVPLYVPLQQGVDSAAESAVADGAIMSALAAFEDQRYQISYVLGGVVQDTAIPDFIVSSITSVRKDCVAFISPPADTVVGQLTSAAEQALSAFVSTLPSSTYAFVDSGWMYQYDRFNNVYVWVPLNGSVAGLDAALPDMWDSPAGYTQTIKNCIKLAYNPSTQASRDFLYQQSINPVMLQPGQGFILFGDKTFTLEDTAFNRINTRMLFIYLETNLKKFALSALFKFNTPATRTWFVNNSQPFCDDVYGRGGMQTRATIICDTTNNTQSVVDNHQFVANIQVTPQYTIESILLQFTAVNGSVSVTESPVLTQ